MTGSVLLLRELDRQARLQGGAVYMLNGNHESLNVCGDFRWLTVALLLSECQSRLPELCLLPMMCSDASLTELVSAVGPLRHNLPTVACSWSNAGKAGLCAVQRHLLWYLWLGVLHVAAATCLKGLGQFATVC